MEVFAKAMKYERPFLFIYNYILIYLYSSKLPVESGVESFLVNSFQYLSDEIVLFLLFDFFCLCICVYMCVTGLLFDKVLMEGDSKIQLHSVISVQKYYLSKMW